MSNDNDIRLMPKAVQDFEELRHGGYVYVDKTDMVWKIANGEKYNFLSRPRRFGKSLLVSTLHYYFDGRDDLFQGLKIMDMEKEWPKRQVFHFDFSGCECADDLSSYLNFTLAKYEEEYGREAAAKTNKDRFLSLIQRGNDKYGKPVAVLVDEYDTPLQHTLYDKDEHEEVCDIYRSFFPALKTGGKYVKCLFITGITKFTQLSLFSTLNNISIIGSWPEYSTVCGITREEMTSNFRPELERMEEKNEWNLETTLDELCKMYDGYHFAAASMGVYNPYSVINALSRSEITNYWISSGATSMVSEMLQHVNVSAEDMEQCVIDKDALEMNDVSLDQPELFLYQAGYLTIKDFDGDFYTLGIPNNEVRTSFFKMVLPNAVGKMEYEVNSSIKNIKSALKVGDVEGAMDYLQQLVSETPYAKKGDKEREDRYRFIVKNALFLCGCQMEEEKQMETGQIDLVAHFRNIIMVMELKLDNNKGIGGAEKQLMDRNYVSAFSAEKKEVYAIAISFACGGDRSGISSKSVKRIK